VSSGLAPDGDYSRQRSAELARRKGAPIFRVNSRHTAAKTEAFRNRFPYFGAPFLPAEQVGLEPLIPDSKFMPSPSRTKPNES
jgi:hypothetical protein